MNAALLVATVLDVDDLSPAPGAIVMPGADSGQYGSDTSQAGGEE